MSFDSDSELSSLPSDYEDDDEPLFTPATTPHKKTQTTTRPSTQRATAKSKHDLKQSTALKPARTVNYSAASLCGWIHDKSLDLNPEYQRDVVWTGAKQMYLIDSIFHNYHIPQIVFATTQTEDGEFKRTCIDGKQRLTSIERFMSGEIAFKDSFTNRKKWFKDGPGPKRKLLEDRERKQFECKQITCVEYDDPTPDQEREIFQRVQMGVSLTPAERMAATNGPHANLTRDLQKRIDSKEGFTGHLDWEHARGKDFQSVARIVFLVGTSLKNKSKQAQPPEPTVVRLEPFLSRKNLITENLPTVVGTTISIFCRIAQNPQLSQIIRKDERLSPLEFVMIAHLIYCYQLTLSETQLADAVAQLRSSIRRNCSDMRFNNKAYKHALTFILNVGQLRLRSDGCGDVPAAQAADPVHQQASTSGRRKPAPVREPSEDSMDMSEDDKPLSRRAATKGQKRKRDASLASRTDSVDEGASVRKRPPAPPRTSASRSSVKTGMAAPVSSGKTARKVDKSPPKKTSAGSGKLSQVGIPSKRPPPSSKTKAAAASSSSGMKAPPSRASNAAAASLSAPPVASTSAFPSNPLSFPKRVVPPASTAVSPLISTDDQRHPTPVKSEGRASPAFQAGPSGDAPAVSNAPTSTGYLDRLRVMREAKTKHPFRNGPTTNVPTPNTSSGTEPQDIPQKPPSRFPNFHKNLPPPNAQVATVTTASVSSVPGANFPENPEVSFGKLESYFSRRPESNVNGMPVASTAVSTAQTPALPPSITSTPQTPTLPPSTSIPAQPARPIPTGPRVRSKSRVVPQPPGGLLTPASDSTPLNYFNNSMVNIAPPPPHSSPPLGNSSMTHLPPVIIPSMNVGLQLPLTPASSVTPPTMFSAPSRVVSLNGTAQQPTPTSSADGSSFPDLRRSLDSQTTLSADGSRGKLLRQESIDGRIHRPVVSGRNPAPESETASRSKVGALTIWKTS